VRGLSPVNCDPGAEVDRENPKNAKSAKAVSARPQRRDDNAGHHQSHAGETTLGRDYRAEPLPKEQTHVVHPTAEPSIDARVHASLGYEQSQGDQEHHGAGDLEHEPPAASACRTASSHTAACELAAAWTQFSPLLPVTSERLPTAIVPTLQPAACRRRAIASAGVPSSAILLCMSHVDPAISGRTLAHEP
jgi:hypothetical protein